MGITFTTHDILGIARKMECNAARFYRHAAKQPYGRDIRKILLQLAEWESEHAVYFAELSKQTPSGNLTRDQEDSNEDLAIYLRVIECLDLFKSGEEPDEMDKKIETRQDLVAETIKKEKDSVIYYTILKRFLPAGDDKRKVDEIIKEEMRHIAILHYSLKNW